MIGSVALKTQGYGVTQYVTMRGLTSGGRHRDMETGEVFVADALMDVEYPLPCATEPYRGYLRRLERVDI